MLFKSWFDCMLAVDVSNIIYSIGCAIIHAFFGTMPGFTGMLYHVHKKRREGASLPCAIAAVQDL